MNALIAVAHGSRDPRSSATVHDAVALLRSRRPDLEVRSAFLDLTAPGVDEVFDDLARAGHDHIVAVPLLLGSAFHAKVDLPALLEEARRRHRGSTIVQADVLGDDPLLIDAVRDRILETGVDAQDPSVGIAVAAVGSSSAEANDRTRRIADAVRRGTSWSGAVTCFATSTEPTAPQAVEQLIARGATRIVVAPWFLAPGRLTDRIDDAVAHVPSILRADVIGAHPAVAEVISRRFDTALTLYPRIPAVSSVRR